MNVHPSSGSQWGQREPRSTATQPTLTPPSKPESGDRYAIPSGVKALWAQAFGTDDPGNVAAKLRQEEERQEIRERLFRLAGFSTVSGTGGVTIDVSEVAAHEEALARGRAI